MEQLSVHTNDFDSSPQKAKRTHMMRFDIRVPEADLAAWRQEAARAGVLLSEWVRETLNANTEVPNVAAVTPAVSVPVPLQPEAATPPETIGEWGTKPIDEAEYAKTLTLSKAALQNGVLNGLHRLLKTCAHGHSRGMHCWQCGGLAKVGE